MSARATRVAPQIPDIIARLAAEGSRLFPVASRGKTPLISDWPNQASNDNERLTFWVRRWPDSNWGVATGAGSGVVVVDCDGDKGRKSIERLSGIHGVGWLQTRTAKTPRGMHLYYLWPDGETRIRNSAGKIAKGIDVRGEGGYVVVPPSVHPSGESYAWQNLGPLAPVPGWLLELMIDDSAEIESKKSNKCNGANAKIPQGQRNQVLASLAGTMRRRGIDADGILAALLAHNARYCDPPMAEKEVRAIARSVSRYPAADEPVIAKEIEALTRPDMPEAVLDGRLGEICQRRMKHTPRAYAWPALVTVAGVNPFLKYDGQHLRGNLFTCLVGDVGTAKSTAMENVLHLAGIDALDQTLLRAKYGSAEGLTADLKDQASCVRLLAPDELSHLLRSCAIEHASFPSFLTTAFYQDRQRGGTKRHTWQVNCRLSILGGIVEDTFGDCFGITSVAGLYDRFLFGLCPRPYTHEYYPFHGAPESISMSAPEVCADVWELRSHWCQTGVSPRVAEIALRVAYICAAADGRKLRARDLGPAYELAKYEMKVRDILRPNPGRNPDAQCAHTILNWLREHASLGEWVKRRDLQRGIHADRFGPGVFSRCLQNLQFCDEVELDLKRKLVRLLWEDCPHRDEVQVVTKP
jgi:Bifunctional DNA primase/polymerase, N-terminal/Primase C terminal 1 (PriCT-1)